MTISQSEPQGNSSQSSNVHAVVMCGGQGKRLWPASTHKTPKQFLPFMGAESLLEQTLKRLGDLVPVDHRWIVSVEDQVRLIQKQTAGLMPLDHCILEPEGRNTAPCIFLALAQLAGSGAKDEDVILFVPSDHFIPDANRFQETLEAAIDLAQEKNFLVTIGLTPNRPHTGYGHIKRGAEIKIPQKKNKAHSTPFFTVDKFVEKPPYDIAVEYTNSGNYYWNGGMFVARLSVWREEFLKHVPELANFWQSWVDTKREIFSSKDLKHSVHLKKLLCLEYAKVSSIAIDVALFEKSSKVAVVAADFFWSDLGAWDTFFDLTDYIDGNQADKNLVLQSKETVQKSGAVNNLVFAPGKKVALAGVKDLIIVDTEDGLLVVHKDHAQEVKNLVDLFKKS